MTGNKKEETYKTGTIKRVTIPPGARKSWSIGIYVGESPFQFRQPPGLINPVLSREDICDVPASFVADPFMIRTGDGWHMFFEIKNWLSRKGEIGVARSKDGFEWRYQQVVLDEPFHLSYPYVFEWNNDYYMIPETLQPGHVRLYRAISFPTKWSYVGPLVDGAFADPSIFLYEGRWWLFVCATPYRHDTLRLYFADDLMGPWVEHEKSPLVEGNANIARPGGRVIIYEGKPIRYTQDCFPAYGTQVRAFEICELTPTSYSEQESANSPVLTPSGTTGWSGEGMHHVDPHLTPEGLWIASVDGNHLE